MTVTSPTESVPPAIPGPLPPAVGPLSRMLFDLITAERPGRVAEPLDEVPMEAFRSAVSKRDALGDDDLHLALYCCFELAYRGFADVHPAWENAIPVLQIRALLESVFVAALEATVPRDANVDDERVGDLLFELERDDDGPPLSRYLETRGTLDQFREFVAHRSAYQLKEADPHSWAIPRIDGPPKTALLEVQWDEYGGGRSERMHSCLFAKTMIRLGLDPTPNAFVAQLPGTTLATVNLMSALGMRRERRGAIVGHLAMFEMSSSRPNRAYGNGLRRLETDAETTDFFDEHVAADAVHENIAAYDLAGGLAKQDPALAADIIFGARALLELESRFAGHLLECWEDGETSLRAADDAALMAAV